MNQTNIPVKQRSCFKCGFRGETSETICPTCSRKLQTSTSIRVRGLILVLCGVLLIGMMGYITLWMVSLLNNPTPNGGKFTGTHEQLMIIFALFGAIIMFGIISLLTGLWQLILGWRNKFFTWSVVGLGVLLFIGGYLFLWRFKQ